MTIGLYTYGAPKVGNWVFSQMYDRLVPDSFRLVVDGDVVCATPPTTSYVHVGTEVITGKSFKILIVWHLFHTNICRLWLMDLVLVVL